MNTARPKLSAKLIHFPDPRLWPEDIVKVGGELSVELLYEAYANGIFPWPQPGLPMLWYCPRERGILEFARLRIPQSVRKLWRQKKITVTVNQDFSRVIRGCASATRPGQQGTWITPEVVRGYEAFHAAGFAHSVECWDGSRLVGGVYGVCVRGVFAAESMFFAKPNASKMGLLYLLLALAKMGHTWVDVQMVTSLTGQWGAQAVSRGHFLKRLGETQGVERVIDWPLMEELPENF